MTKTVALIQARMSSTRFPGKVLADLAGRPMILFMVERARRAQRVDEVVVVTSVDVSDDPLAEVLHAHNVPIFRGDLVDVLKRYADAAGAFEASVIVRLTGDCPLIDPVVIDRVIAHLTQNALDYASNVDPARYADGLDVECFTRKTLDRAHREALRKGEREHVTLWMRTRESGLRRGNVESIVDSSHLRVTVDYPDDLKVVRRLIGLLGANSMFDTFDLLRALEHEPDLRDLNRHERNEALIWLSTPAS